MYTIITGRFISNKIDRLEDRIGKEPRSPPERKRGIAEVPDQVLVGNEPEFMARDGPGHLVKKVDREGECVAAIASSASG
jgi:hypothetical protein